MRVLLLLVWVAACGSERSIEPKTAEAPPPQGPVEPGSVLSFNEVLPIMTTSCKPCHASDAFLKSSTGWFASAAPKRVANNSMPPPASTAAKNLSDLDRGKLLNFK